MVYFDMNSEGDDRLRITAVAIVDDKIQSRFETYGADEECIKKFAEFLQDNGAFSGIRKTELKEVRMFNAISLNSGSICLALLNLYIGAVCLDMNVQYDIDLYSYIIERYSYLDICVDEVFDYFKVANKSVDGLHELSKKIFEGGNVLILKEYGYLENICKNIKGIQKRSAFPGFFASNLSLDLARLYINDIQLFTEMFKMSVEVTAESKKEEFALILRMAEKELERIGKAEDFTEKALEICPELKKFYPTQLTCNILDGENRIGANLIEISYKNTKILVECGEELEPSERGEKIRKEILTKRYNACVVTHSHPDHSGLIEQISKKTEVFIGEKAKVFLPKIVRENKHVKSYGKKFAIGQINITPYLCDHSSYDSYMLSFEAGGKTVLYTGDFRGTGRKNYDKLLMRLPENIDTLICEHTNDYDGESYTEEIIERKLAEYMSGDKDVYVLCAVSNIDRIVSVYKACNRSKRKLWVDLAQAKILNDIGGSIPHPRSHKNISVFDKSMKKLYDSSAPLTVLVRASMADCCAELMKARGNSVLIYSMWSGYLKGEHAKEDIVKFTEKAKIANADIKTLHISGHASNSEIKRLIEKVKPENVVYVHNKPLIDNSTDCREVE